MNPSHIMPNFFRRTLPLLTLAFAAACGVSAHAQQPLVPIPFVTTIAGLAAGSGNVQCSSAVDIPNTQGAHLGDGCLPTQAILITTYGSFTDSIGNIYISENGTDNDIRVIYKGGAALTAMLIASNAQLTNFTPIPGRIYTLAGARAATLTKVGTVYPCNGLAGGAPAIDSAGDGCPGAQAYIKPRGLSVDRQRKRVLRLHRRRQPGEGALRWRHAGGEPHRA